MSRTTRKAVTEVPEDLPILLDARDAAAIFGTTPKTMLELCRSGEVSAVRLGGTWRIHRDAFLEQLGLA